MRQSFASNLLFTPLLIALNRRSGNVFAKNGKNLAKWEAHSSGMRLAAGTHGVRAGYASRHFATAASRSGASRKNLSSLVIEITIIT